VASWPGGPSYDPGHGAGARAPAPCVPSPPAPWCPGQWGHGCRSTGPGAHGSGTCRAGTCGPVGPPSPLTASRGAHCASGGGSPAGTGLAGRQCRVGGHSHTPAAGHPDGGRGWQRGSVQCRPASPGWPACAHGAHSVPRPAGKRQRERRGGSRREPLQQGAGETCGSRGAGSRGCSISYLHSKVLVLLDWVSRMGLRHSWRAIQFRGIRSTQGDKRSRHSWSLRSGEGRSKTMCEAQRSRRAAAGEGKPRLEEPHR